MAASVEAFGEIVGQFKSDPNQTDPFSLVEGFRRVTLSMNVSGLHSNRNVQNWALETKFWCLLSELIRFRNYRTITPSTTKNESDVDMREYIHSKSASLQEKWIIISWLMSNPRLEMFETFEPLDEESSFFRSVFHLLIENKVEEAITKCKENSNWRLAMVVSGLTHYENRLLWRRTVFQLSQSPQINKFERAIYGFMCGDVDSCLSVTETWESRLLVCVNNMYQSEMEDEVIAERARMKKPVENEILAMGVPVNRFSNYREIFSHAVNTKDMLPDPLYMFLESLITGDMAELFKDSIRALEVSGESFSVELLRVIVHFALFMKFVDESVVTDADVCKLVEVYKSQVLSHSFLHLVPVYLSFVPNEDAFVSSYCEFLTHVADRSQQVAIMRDLQLPLELILKTLVGKVFNETASQYKRSEGYVTLSEPNEVSQSDRLQIDVLGWYFDSNMVEDAVECSVILLRRLLLCGKFNAAMQLSSCFDLNKLYNDYSLKIEYMKVPDTFLAELKNHCALITSLEAIQKFEVSDTYVENVIKITTETMKSYLVDVEDSPVFQELRFVYVTYLLNALFDLLVKTNVARFVKQALELINLISDEKFEFYDILLATENLDKFLYMYANASLAVACL